MVYVKSVYNGSKRIGWYCNTFGLRILNKELHYMSKMGKVREFHSTNPVKIYAFNVSFFKYLYKAGRLGKLSDRKCASCDGKPDVWFKSRTKIARTVSDILPYCQKCATEQQCREEEAIGATKKPTKDSTSASLKQ